MRRPARLIRPFTRFANAVARTTGRPASFGLCLLAVLVWAVTGPLFRFSDTWQLVINTGTTVITFLMVFLIQNTQNRESAAIQAKLDELIWAMDKAENRFIGIEHLTDRELDEIIRECEARVAQIRQLPPGAVSKPASDFAEPAGSPK
jgi:low affinity Fe/Cu permease